LLQLFQIVKNANQEDTSKEKGTGLGLILIKKLVDANQGTIEVTSKVDKGITFLVSFSR
jgi:signal transduction histidine kinase